ncbi:MAG TPA: DUF2339 domain-containing protein [Gammaproteobacteria bacterium]|nr:DUF2339 domain-containing protein [Gammaproteobacteria bacterium]
MYILFIIIGLMAGLILAAIGDDSYGFTVVVLATLAGLFVAETIALRRRLRQLELQQPSVTQKPVETPASVARPTTEPLKQTRAQTTDSLWPVDEALSRSVTKQQSESANNNYFAQKTTQFIKTAKAALRWLLSGNVPVKLGVLVSFFGIAFFLKYAADQGWVSAPIEVKVAGVAAFGIGLLVLGWRLRFSHRAYGLSLQGGGVGVLFLTIFTAFSQFNLLSPQLAFVLLVLLAIAASVLAWLQRAQALAAIGCLGGFLAPLLISTGSGNYVVLFAYYTLLNLAVFGLAWITRWRWLNLIGFVFTFGIGAAWGVDSYTAAMFNTVEPFLVINFLLYTTIAVLYGLRAPPNFKRVVDSTLVFGTPLVCFPLQAGLLQGDQRTLAISAFVVALLYAAIAGLIYRLGKQRLLLESFVALAVAFVTIAIPLALSAEWTAVSWVLEGVALVWVGVRQDRRLPPLAGFGLLLIGAPVYAANMVPEAANWAFLNNEFLSGLIVSGAAYMASVVLWRSNSAHQKVLGVILYAWGLLWLLITGSVQIIHSAVSLNDYLIACFVLYLAFVQGANLLAARYYGLLFASSWYGYLPLLAIMALLRVMNNSVPLSTIGWLVWPVALCVHYLGFRFALPGVFYRRLLRGAGLWLAALLLAVQVYKFLDITVDAAIIWCVAAAMLVIAAVIETGHWLANNTDEASWRIGGSGPLLAVLVFWVLAANLTLSALPAPLPYIPLLNPLDLITLLTGFLTWRVFGRAYLQSATPQAKPLLAGLVAATGLYLLTCMLARVIHHWGGVPYTLEAMGESVLFQAALSITWALAGLSGMIMGARKHQRLLWFASAGLMGVVVLKLFAVDLGNSGTVERIVSFIGVGLLLLVVGYFAPAPKAHIEKLQG